jgi:exodeoxyribonuclease VII large subunit
MNERSPAPRGDQNIPVFSVGEISAALKRTVEEAFRLVRVRGEVSGFKRAHSGHLYFTLKDEEAVLSAVCWRGVAARLKLAPEDGLEVIATGRITTYAGRSQYQIIVESVELAGEGALLKLLEERKKKLAAEGLFDAARKKPLPFLPEVIGVVTSPTGAVIRDILHRLEERFPRRVLLWPVAVQGESAAAEIARAIEGFNRLAVKAPLPRPDLLIVARGGGSLEDLWPFNEEIVVRAAARSAIPLISAVGHETDVTLIDLAADKRAPTPSAAAEIAVPVRADLLEGVLGHGARLLGAMNRLIEARRGEVRGLGRGLPDPAQLLDGASQRLDDRQGRPARAPLRHGRPAEGRAPARRPRTHAGSQSRQAAAPGDGGASRGLRPTAQATERPARELLLSRRAQAGLRAGERGGRKARHLGRRHASGHGARPSLP